MDPAALVGFPEFPPTSDPSRYSMHKQTARGVPAPDLMVVPQAISNNIDGQRACDVVREGLLAGIWIALPIPSAGLLGSSTTCSLALTISKLTDFIGVISRALMAEN